MKEVLLDKRKTLIIKAGGIILMLFHHLFYSIWSQAYYDDFTLHGVGIINKIGLFCKLCVAVFVFVSGYGLAVSTPNDVSLKDFYQHRFKKLYLNYWFIWLLFVPICIFYGRTFTVAYGENALLKAGLDFFGLAKMFGIESYNPTWWFYNTIVILYLLFPLLNKWLWKVPFLFIAFALTIVFVSFLPVINVIGGYLFIFIIGMFMAKMPLEWIDNTKLWHIVLSLIMLSAWRFTKYYPTHITDALICSGIAILLFKVSCDNWIGKIFEKLGKHSINMFLIHTFIFYYWFTKYIYITRNPILIFLSLLTSSYIASVIIEWIKRKIGFYKL